MNDPNDVWKKFDFFIRGRLKYMPDRFVYPNMDRYPAVERERVVYEIMDMLVKNDYNCKLREIMQDWHAFSKEDANGQK